MLKAPRGQRQAGGRTVTDDQLQEEHVLHEAPHARGREAQRERGVGKEDGGENPGGEFEIVNPRNDRAAFQKDLFLIIKAPTAERERGKDEGGRLGGIGEGREERRSSE
eukprot:9484234-Pyramimonas_sp.AAC.1